MHNPRYEGFNNDGGKYVVTAKTAVQDLTDLSRVTLNDIVGDLVDANKTKTNLKATHGFYNSKTNSLELFDGIDIVSESGMHARLTRANVLTKENLIVSKEPVTVEMPGGTIRSNEMTLHNKTRKVAFLNSVTAHLVPAEQPKAAAAAKTATPSATPMLSATNGPIDITSDRLDIDDTKKLAVFSGSVRATQGDAVLETASLEVQYAGDSTGGALANAAGAKIKRIASSSPVVMTRAPQDRVTGNSLDFDALNQVAVLAGDVVMISGSDRRATGDEAQIDQKADTVLLTGDVAVVQGRNQLNGGRLFVERATGHTQLTNPAAPGAKEPGRISTRFYRTADDTQKSGAAGAKAAPAASAVGVFKTDPTAPIDVEADRLDVDDHGKTALFRGSVRAAQGDFTVRTSSLKAYYTGQAGLAEQKDPSDAKQPAQLTRIEARGKVIVTSKNGQDATGDWADFDVKANQVTLGGDVVLTQDKNVVRGTRLVIDMATGKSVIHNDPSAAWTAEAAPEGDKNGYVVQGPSNNRRPSAIFYPKQKKASSPPPATNSPSTSGGSWTPAGETP
jgi:lipopolysaccharide transport protein LptA/LPS export ABC transporter protein LptC